MTTARSDARGWTARTRRTRVGVGWVWLLLASVGCGVEVYDLGLPSRGTRFSLPAGVALNPSPVVQSWAAYSLAKSTCQLEIGGPRPAANSSFACELRPREVLVERWASRFDSAPAPAPAPAPGVAADRSEQDEYLDLLVRVEQAGFLAEYVWFYLRERDWIRPDWLKLDAFEPWRREHLKRHRPQTRLIGYWTHPG